jgi:hypothetical protein
LSKLLYSSYSSSFFFCLLISNEFNETKGFTIVSILGVLPTPAPPTNVIHKTGDSIHPFLTLSLIEFPTITDIDHNNEQAM